jgi:hypothetical protein
MQKHNNSGVLFKNDKKGNDNAPDYKGDFLIEGQEYWLSAWVKDGRAGKYMSLAVSPREPRKEETQNQKQNSKDLDDLPF